MLVLNSCSLVQNASQQSRRPQAPQPSPAEALQQCRQRRELAKPLVARFREQFRQQRASEQAVYRPGPGQPKPLDPDEQRRLAPYDQEIEEDQYRQALAAWQQQESERRQAWRQAHELRLQQARRGVEQAAAALRRLEPSVVDPAAPTGLNEAELSALERCGKGP